MRKLTVQQWVTVANIAAEKDLKLVEATGFENGLALLRYEIKN